MRKRPLALILASCIFLYFPALLFSDFFRGLPTTTVDWLLSGVLPLILTIGLLKVNRVAWYTLFCFVFLWGIRDFQDIQTDETPVWKVLIHLGVYLLGVSYFINPQIRRLYFDPKLRQWRTKRRFETHGPAIIQKGEKYTYPILRNISEGGCFLETPHPLEVLDRLHIIIPLPVPLELSSLQLTGEVRWISDKQDKMGMGIQFHNPQDLELKVLKKFVAQLS